MAVKAPDTTRPTAPEPVGAPAELTRAPGAPWRRRGIWLAAVVAVFAIGLQLSGGFPDGLVVDVGNVFDRFRQYAIENNDTSAVYRFILNPIDSGMSSALEQVQNLLNRMTFLGVIVGATALAGVIAGWRMAILAAIGFTVMGLFGLWERSMETLALMLVSVSIALAIGIPVGIWAGRRPTVERLFRPVLDAMQTIPAFSYLLPLVLLFSSSEAIALVSTVVFALPPAVRLTTLGIREVPPTALEVGRSFGCTRKQVLRKVQLPMARPSIMLGVNQTIMMALGMVVIAAVVGIGGLGREVLNGLQILNVGAALNGGITIVLMAIVLDRVSYAWSVRDRRRRPTVNLLGRSFSRRQIAIAAAGITIAAVLVGREVLRQQDFPGDWTISVATPANAAVDWSQVHLRDATKAISTGILTYLLNPLRHLLADVPWWMIAGGAAALAWQVSRRWRLAAMCFLCLFAIGVMGMWVDAMDTLSQVLVAVVISVVIAIPLGIWSALNDGVQRAIKPALDAMQTMPAFVYLVPVIALFEVGRVPGVIASVVYALPPAIRLTDLGIRQVPVETVEAAVAYGATKGQLLRKVQLPLARPSILLGINQTIMMALSVVIIAGLIGGGALGFIVVQSLAKTEIGRGIVAGLSIMLLAIVIDRITQAMGMQQRSLRGPVGTGGLGWWTRLQAITGKSNGAGGSVPLPENVVGKGEG
jgi:glycine betaine/proline transport system permease protein